MASRKEIHNKITSYFKNLSNIGKWSWIGGSIVVVGLAVGLGVGLPLSMKSSTPSDWNEYRVDLAETFPTNDPSGLDSLDFSGYFSSYYIDENQNVIKEDSVSNVLAPDYKGDFYNVYWDSGFDADYSTGDTIAVGSGYGINSTYKGSYIQFFLYEDLSTTFTVDGSEYYMNHYNYLYFSWSIPSTSIEDGAISMIGLPTDYKIPLNTNISDYSLVDVTNNTTSQNIYDNLLVNDYDDINTINDFFISAFDLAALETPITFPTIDWVFPKDDIVA